MKLRHYVLALSAAILLPLTASSQLPGPAIAGTVTSDQLPEKARTMLKETFKESPVKRIVKDFADQEYDVRLADGIELEFNAQGDLLEIEAPDGLALSYDLIKALVPDKAWARLVSDGVTRRIDGIKFKKGRVVAVEIMHERPVDAYIFDWDGDLILLED